jgi:hypothetical protein
MGSSSSSDRPDMRSGATIPAGGMSSPPSDPPAASPTPLRGQKETNRQLDARQSSPEQPSGNPKQEDMYSAAFEFGWQSRLQYGRAAATQNISFEKIEPELEKQWSQRQAAKDQRLPWQAARDTARDAWNQVYDALAGDSQAKTNTNG